MAMFKKLCSEFESSLRRGVHGYALPIVILLAGFELEVMIRIINWISDLSFWSGIKILPFLL